MFSSWPSVFWPPVIKRSKRLVNVKCHLPNDPENGENPHQELTQSSDATSFVILKCTTLRAKKVHCSCPFVSKFIYFSTKCQYDDARALNSARCRTSTNSGSFRSYVRDVDALLDLYTVPKRFSIHSPLSALLLSSTNHIVTCGCNGEKLHSTYQSFKSVKSFRDTQIRRHTNASLQPPLWTVLTRYYVAAVEPVVELSAHVRHPSISPSTDNQTFNGSTPGNSHVRVFECFAGECSR